MSASLPPIADSRVWHPYTAIPHPGPRALLVRAEGAHIYDAEGRKFFDATSSWWSCLHGHCHPDLVRALRNQSEQLDQVLFAPHAHPVALELADKLTSVLGTPFEKVFFSDDGSTSVEAALKMALQYWVNRGEPQRTRFLSVELGYHGDTLGAVSVGHLDEFHRFFPQLLETDKSTAPYCYRCPLGKQYPACGIACLDKARSVLAEHGEKIAALIVEPLVLGAGGLICYPKDYLDGLMALCRERGVLVIFDEVFTGFGRTGTMFALEQTKLRPDMVCLSKGLTSGMLALGATVTTREIFDAFTGSERRKFYHGHTFTANALACSVALESLKIFERDGVVERNRGLAARLAQETARFAALPHVGEVRGLGCIWAVELARDKATRALYEPANGPGWKIATRAWEQGIWLRPMGAALYVIPPYCAREEDLRHCFDVMYAEVQREENYL